MQLSTPALHLQLASFEGPLDLLLHLIQKHEVNIFDIPIAFITERYLEYIEAFQQVDLGLAGEYLVMAATLLQIKSQLLLPRPEPVELDDDATNVDPREALVRRLLEYQRYKEAARELGGRELVDRDVFRRPSRAEELEREAGPPELVPLELFHLLRALQTLLQDRPAEAVQEITPDRLTVRQCMTTIADHLRTVRRTALLDLVYLSAEAPTRLDIVVTFMAILELARLRIIRVSQDRLTARDLFIERAIEDWDPSTAWLDEAEEPR